MHSALKTMLWSLVGTLVIAVSFVTLRPPRPGCEEGYAAPTLINQTLANAIDMYRATRRDYPPSLETLVALKRLHDDQLFDPWGRPVRYVVQGDAYHLCSGGRDRELDTADDICRTAHGGRSP